jgi:uncharacterized damage-inducible protein DinB
MKYQLSQARQVLERTPGVLRAMLDGLSDAWILPNEGSDTWSPRDVVAHLVGAERGAWIPRVRHLLDFGEDRPFQSFDRTAEIVASADKPIHALLDDFAQLRRDSLAVLDALKLSESQLERTGTHPEFGTVRLHDLLATWVVHDLSHTAQIVRVMATQYRDEVGPWRAYLRVIR